jgi:hypothetical protein
MKRWLIAISIGANQFVNAIVGGSPSETVSARAAIAREHGSTGGRRVCVVLDVIDVKKKINGEDHCAKALRHLHERVERARP